MLDGVDVYPSRRKIWASILGFAVFFLAFAGWVVSTIVHGLHGPIRRVLLGPVGLVFCGWALIAAVRELRHPIPLAHLDEAGFECALGRVQWQSVAVVSVRWHWVWAGAGSYPSRRVFFDLRPPE